MTSRHQLLRISALGALAFTAVVTSACDDGIAPPGPKASVSLDFCADDTPVWFAIQNEQDAWREISADAAGTFTFDATPRVSIAYVVSDDSDHSTEIFNVAREELDRVSGEMCISNFGTKSLNGSVTGLTGQQVVRITMGSATAGASANTPGFILASLPDGQLDLVATRSASAGTQPPDRVIVRRNLNLTNGATIPALDFGAAESQPFASATVMFANRGTDPVSVITYFLSATGTEHQLMQFTNVNADGSVFVSVPEALRGPADLHALDVFAAVSSGDRRVRHFYRNPSNRTLTLGPPLSAPGLSTVATTPYRRLRLSIASQPEYPSAMEANFAQLVDGVFRSVTILTSADFLGGRPTTWVLEIPDLSSAGYESQWGIPSSGTIGGQLSAGARGFDADVGLWIAGAPSDGDVITSASRSASEFVALSSGVTQREYRPSALRRLAGVPGSR
jgi:hypothetical protein